MTHWLRSRISRTFPDVYAPFPSNYFQFIKVPSKLEKITRKKAREKQFDKTVVHPLTKTHHSRRLSFILNYEVFHDDRNEENLAISMEVLVHFGLSSFKYMLIVPKYYDHQH